MKQTVTQHNSSRPLRCAGFSRRRSIGAHQPCGHVPAGAAAQRAPAGRVRRGRDPVGMAAGPSCFHTVSDFPYCILQRSLTLVSVSSWLFISCAPQAASVSPRMFFFLPGCRADNAIACSMTPVRDELVGVHRRNRFAVADSKFPRASPLLSSPEQVNQKLEAEQDALTVLQNEVCPQ